MISLSSLLLLVISVHLLWPGLRRPLRHFNTELLGVLGVQSLKAELHGLGPDSASNGLTGEKVIQNIETNVPTGSTHCDEVPIDAGPQRQARAAA